jgi:hypothetical protein
VPIAECPTVLSWDGFIIGTQLQWQITLYQNGTS